MVFREARVKKAGTEIARRRTGIGGGAA